MARARRCSSISSIERPAACSGRKPSAPMPIRWTAATSRSSSTTLSRDSPGRTAPADSCLAQSATVLSRADLTLAKWSDDQTAMVRPMPTPPRSDNRFETVRKVRRYEQVADQLRALISGGTLKPGDLLPPERDLAKKL